MWPDAPAAVETPLEESARRLEALVSPFTGIVRGVEEVLAEPDDLRLVNLFCETGWIDRLVGRGTKHAGAGSAPTRLAARAAAVAEAVERYSACHSDHADAVVSTAAALDGRAVAPNRFALFSASQYAAEGFPYAPFTPETTVAWVQGVALPGGEPALLPAQLVYLGWRLRPGERPIVRSTSNGLACHATVAEAALTGLLELVERDAFMLTWHARLSWPRLAWDAAGDLGAWERRYVGPTGLRTAAIDLSEVWDVPCVLGVARPACAGEAPLGVGAAAAPTVERAIRKALDEAVRVRSWARALRRDDPGGEHVPDADRIVDFDEHIRYHAYDEHAAAADFLDASDEVRDVARVPPLPGASPGERVEAICRRLEQRGASAYAVDVTAPDVHAAGLRVVKVIAPELCPLDVDHGARHLGGRRLYEEPFRLGKRSRPLEEQDVNPDPHPFP